MSKRTLIIASLFLMTPFAARAGGVRHPITARASAGVLSSTLAANGGSRGEFESLIGQTLALSVAREQSPHSSLESGIRIEHRGGAWLSSFTPDGLYIPDGFRRRLDLVYIGVPVRLRITMSRGAIAPSMHVGAEGSLLVWSRQETRDRVTNYSQGAKVSVGDQTRAFDLAWTFGGGVQAHLAERTLFLDVTYVRDLTSVNDGRFRIEGSLPSIATRAYRFEMGTNL
jgi:hypothetical protein